MELSVPISKISTEGFENFRALIGESIPGPEPRAPTPEESLWFLMKKSVT